MYDKRHALCKTDGRRALFTAGSVASSPAEVCCLLEFFPAANVSYKQAIWSQLSWGVKKLLEGKSRLRAWTVEAALDVTSFDTSWIYVSKCFDFLLGLVAPAYATASCFHHLYELYYVLLCYDDFIFRLDNIFILIVFEAGNHK
jgi:hypothetical protein